MSQGITFDINARITGYEASLKQLREDLKKIDPGSDIGKNIEKSLKQAESRVANLSKNLTPKITSESQLESYIEKFNLAGQSIQNVANLMQNVKIGDINFSAFDSSIQKMLQDLQNLETELDNKITAGFQNAITNSQELSKTFKDLDINIENKNAGQIFDELAKKAEEAAAKTDAAAKVLKSAEDDLNKKQTSLNAIKNNPIFQKEDVENQFRDIAKVYTDTFNNIKEQVQAGLIKLLGSNNPQSKKIYEAFIKDLSPENLRAHLTELKNSIQNVLQTGISAHDIYKTLFGDAIGKSNNSTAVENVLLKDLRPQLATIKQKFQEELQKISPSLTGKQVGTTQLFLTQDQIDKALENTIKAIDEGYTKINGEFIKKSQEVTLAEDKVNEAKGAHTTAINNQSQIESRITQLTEALNKVVNDNNELRKEIENLRAQINDRKERITSNIHNNAQKSDKNVEDFKVPKKELDLYRTELEQIHAKEQLIGKIEGVVQRWFSIYAAVRMVGNAIRSVISTIQELDKTITEIAIVTDMTQQDLWSQMSSYTDMARQYASSISGVYQVSQLYYQQGLQTADVMALTEQTLKMARISGLEYAEATDYMTNAIRSFKMEMTDAQRVVDVYSAVAASSATDTAELANAMSKTASSAESVGSSFENTTAMMAVMIEATRESAENIGSAMKSIISRYGEMTSDPTKLVDSEGQEMSLNRVDKALQTVGISIHDAAGQFRNFDDVITELAGKWDTIDANTQRYIATIMAGNRLILLAVA